MRDPMVKRGDIVSSPNGKSWCVVVINDAGIVLRMCDDEGVLIGIHRGGERREIRWEEWGRGAGNSNPRGGGRRLRNRIGYIECEDRHHAHDGF